MPPVTPSVTLKGSGLGMVCSYEEIVNQARLAQMGGNSDERAAAGVGQRQQSVGINHGGVFHLHRWLGCENLQHGCSDCHGVAFAARVEIGSTVECAMKDGGAAALFRREVAIARAEGEAVGFTHDRA